MIAIISYFNSSPEALNCGEAVVENISASRDGFYFVPLNKDDVPLGTQIILNREPMEGLSKYLSNKNFLGIGPKNADTIAQSIGMKVIKYLHQRKVNILEEKFTITDRNLFESKMNEFSINFNSSLEPLTWIFDLLRASSNNDLILSDFGVEILPKFSNLSLVDLRDLINEEMLQLSEAHFYKFFDRAT